MGNSLKKTTTETGSSLNDKRKELENEKSTVPFQDRWKEWFLKAPVQALKMTIMWALLGANVVLLTTQSRTWPYDKLLEQLLHKRNKAIKVGDDELIEQLTEQLKDEGVLIDDENNQWLYKEFSGDLDGDCYQIPVTLDELYDDWFPTDPNEGPYCLQDDFPSNPTSGDNFSVVDLLPPFPTGKKDKDKDKEKNLLGGERSGNKQLNQTGGAPCEPRENKTPAELSKLRKMCGKHGKCPPPDASCMGGESYACLHPVWGKTKFWSVKTTPESADKFLNKYRPSESEMDEDGDADRFSMFRGGWKKVILRLSWFFVKWGHYLKRLILCTIAYVIIGFYWVIKSVLKLLSGSGSGDLGGSKCSSVKKTGDSEEESKPKSTLFQFWGGAIIFGMLLGIIPINLGMGKFTPFALILLFFALTGSILTAPIIFLLGGYLLLPAIAGPMGIVMPLLLGAFLIFYPMMVFNKHGGYVTPLLRAMKQNLWGLTLMFTVITGLYTGQTQLTSMEKNGVYAGIGLFAVPALFKQFQQFTAPKEDSK